MSTPCLKGEVIPLKIDSHFVYAKFLAKKNRKSDAGIGKREAIVT